MSHREAIALIALGHVGQDRLRSDMVVGITELNPFTFHAQVFAESKFIGPKVPSKHVPHRHYYRIKKTWLAFFYQARMGPYVLIPLEREDINQFGESLSEAAFQIEPRKFVEKL